MRYMLRWWETLTRPERIVAMSLAAGSVVGITNSIVWAIAASYMTTQKAKVELVALQSGAKSRRDTQAAPAAHVEGASGPGSQERAAPENGLIYSGS